MPQTLGETAFDFVTFLTTPKIADVNAPRSVDHTGLKADEGTFSRISTRSLNP